MNFAHGIPICCVSIGVEQDGEMILGAVYNPLMNELFFAQKGFGATLNDKRISVSAKTSISNACLVTGFPYNWEETANNPLNVFERFIRQGLPVRRLVLATNENNVLEEFFRTGIYRPRPAEQTYATSSPSMDISRASNFERFVFDLVGRDAGRVKALWADMARDGFFDLSALKPQFEAQYGFVSGASTHEDRLATIRSLYDETGVLVDRTPPTASKVAREHVEPGVPMLVLETALPAKFSETIEAALGRPATPPGNLANLESLPQRVEVMDCDAAAVRRYIEAHAKV